MFGVVIEVCLSSRTRAPISMQSIVLTLKSQFKELGKIMPKEQRPKKVET